MDQARKTVSFSTFGALTFQQHSSDDTALCCLLIKSAPLSRELKLMINFYYITTYKFTCQHYMLLFILILMVNCKLLIIIVKSNIVQTYLYGGGRILRVKPIIMIFILFTIVFFVPFSVASAENGQNVWNGYDLEVLNTYDSQLVGQNSTIEIIEDKLIYNGEYIVKNKTDKTIEVILGLPSNNLENVQITDRGSSIKHYNRNGSYIEDKYPSESLPKAAKWHTISLWLKGGETRNLNVRYEAKLINDSKGVYSVRYNRNKNLMDSEASTIVLSLRDFFPYNILDTTGIISDKAIFGSNNHLLLEMNKDSEILGLDYELLDKLSIDRLDFGSDKKLKNIAASFRKKEYDTVNTLCDEYIKNPGDPAFSMVQIQYVKAEAYRKQANFEKYFEFLKGLDFEKLYPNRLKYKILYDADRILQGKVQDAQLLAIMKSLQAQAYTDNEYIGKWMQGDGNSYEDDGSITNRGDSSPNKVKEDSVVAKTIKHLKLENIIYKIKAFKYTPLIVIVAAFLLGYLFGRRTKKRKNTISYYTFKR